MGKLQAIKAKLAGLFGRLDRQEEAADSPPEKPNPPQVRADGPEVPPKQGPHRRPAPSPGEVLRPGPRLDRLCAKLVMGWEDLGEALFRTPEGELAHAGPEGVTPARTPHFAFRPSSDHGACGRVVSAMLDNGYLLTQHTDKNARRCHFSWDEAAPGEAPKMARGPAVDHGGASALHATCVAAVMAVAQRQARPPVPDPA